MELLLRNARMMPSRWHDGDSKLIIGRALTGIKCLLLIIPAPWTNTPLRGRLRDHRAASTKRHPALRRCHRAVSVGGTTARRRATRHHRPQRRRQGFRSCEHSQRFYLPQDGTVHYRGKASGPLRCTRLRVTASCARNFQGTHLFSNMSVIDNILVGRYSLMRSGLRSPSLYFPWTQREVRTAPRSGRGHHRLQRNRKHPPPARGRMGYGLPEARSTWSPRACDGNLSLADGRTHGRHEH